MAVGFALSTAAARDLIVPPGNVLEERLIRYENSTSRVELAWTMNVPPRELPDLDIYFGTYTEGGSFPRADKERT